MASKKRAGRCAARRGRLPRDVRVKEGAIVAMESSMSEASMSDAGVLRGVAYHANGHPRHDHDLVASDSTYWWSKQGSDLLEVRRFDPAAENASSAPPITLDVKYGAEGAVVGVEIVERDGVPDLVVLATTKGRVLVWGRPDLERGATGATPSQPSACVESGATDLASVRIISSTRTRTEFVLGSRSTGLGAAAYDAGERSAVCSFFPPGDDQGDSPAPGQDRGSGSLLQNVLGSFANRFQQGGDGSADSRGAPASPLPRSVFAVAVAYPFTIAADASGRVRCLSVRADGSAPELRGHLSLRDAVASELAEWAGKGQSHHSLDPSRLRVTPLDCVAIAGGPRAAVLALVDCGDQVRRAALFVLSVSRRGELSLENRVLLNDAWLASSAIDRGTKIAVAADASSLVVRLADGRACCFACDLGSAGECAGIQLDRFAWGCVSFAHPGGDPGFAFLLNGLQTRTLAQILLDACHNIVEALPKDKAAFGEPGGADPISAQLKSKLEQHFQFASLLHRTGWLDLVDMATAGRIVRAGEHIAALQCIRGKEVLLRDQGGASGAGGLSHDLASASSRRGSGAPDLLRSLLAEASGGHGGAEAFYSRPLASLSFLDVVSRRAESLAGGVNQAAQDVQQQSAVLDSLSRVVTETLSAVESWVRAVDSSLIPVAKGAFGHQEGYAWSAHPSLCDCLLSLSRLCVCYHRQWKRRAPALVPRLSIQLHSLITQFLHVRDAMVEATPKEKRDADAKRFAAYGEAGEEVLGALLSASYEESNHMIQDAVAELAEVHDCHGVLYDLCDKTGDSRRLHQYMRMVDPFAPYAFGRLIEANRVRDLMELPDEFSARLRGYLEQRLGSGAHEELLWMLLARGGEWSDCAGVLAGMAARAGEGAEDRERHLALSKLCELARPAYRTKARAT